MAGLRECAMPIGGWDKLAVLSLASEAEVDVMGTRGINGSNTSR